MHRSIIYSIAHLRKAKLLADTSLLSRTTVCRFTTEFRFSLGNSLRAYNVYMFNSRVDRAQDRAQKKMDRT